MMVVILNVNLLSSISFSMSEMLFTAPSMSTIAHVSSKNSLAAHASAVSLGKDLPPKSLNFPDSDQRACRASAPRRMYRLLCWASIAYGRTLAPSK